AGSETWEISSCTEVSRPVRDHAAAQINSCSRIIAARQGKCHAGNYSKKTRSGGSCRSHGPTIQATCQQLTPLRKYPSLRCAQVGIPLSRSLFKPEVLGLT